LSPENEENGYDSDKDSQDRIIEKKEKKKRKTD